MSLEDIVLDAPLLIGKIVQANLPIQGKITKIDIRRAEGRPYIILVTVELQGTEEDPICCTLPFECWDQVTELIKDNFRKLPEGI